jgi:pimeloyl-ACP methyl ester carboxylesterase
LEVALFKHTAVIFLALGATYASAQEDARPADIVREARRILTPNGIEFLGAVPIGDLQVWVSARGVDRKNPVLLYVHGGPGYVSMPMSWWSTRGWEEYFTVVQFDQRGAGKTYLLNDPGKVEPTLSNERMVQDVEEMIGWAQKTFGQRKVFLLGHSYGSFLGLEVAQRHPEWLHAYIGVGQVVNLAEGERRGWQFDMEAAQRDKNEEAIRELQAIAPYAAPGSKVAIEQVYVQRKWLNYYGGGMAYRKDAQADSALSRLSPDYTAGELEHLWDGNAWSTPYLLPGLMDERPAPSSLKVPLILFNGRHDKNVNSDVSAEWFARVKAPKKHLVWFEHSAHMIMTEEPGKTLVSLLKYARPLAGS